MARMILTGDLNLMNVTDPEGPLRQVRGLLGAADIRFGNLECCLHAPPAGHGPEQEGFFVAPAIGGQVLAAAGFDAVGVANNVNYGADAILSSLAALDRRGIAHTGAGRNQEAAYRPAIVVRNGLRYGFLQRSSVYWPTNHAAIGEAPGIAVIAGHTAYHVPMQRLRPGMPPMNRPGVPPEILTWADPRALRTFTDDIAALREAADVVIASCHWGLGKEVLSYMTEIAHAAIAAGADAVIGHGPHFALPIEIHRGRPIFYGLGSFSFHTGHLGRKHGDWLGMMARLTFDGTRLAGAAFRFVRHNAENETVLPPLADVAEALAEITAASAEFGTRLTPGRTPGRTPLGEEVAIAL